MEDLFSSAQEYKNELFKQLSRIGKSLSSDKRLEILNLLSDSTKTVETLAEDTGMSVENVSRDLQVLKDSKVGTYTKTVTDAFYSFADPANVYFLYALWRMGEDRLSDLAYIN